MGLGAGPIGFYCWCDTGYDNQEVAVVYYANFPDTPVHYMYMPLQLCTTCTCATWTGTTFSYS
jgi:hypothetical protein